MVKLKSILSSIILYKVGLQVDAAQKKLNFLYKKGYALNSEEMLKAKHGFNLYYIKFLQLEQYHKKLMTLAHLKVLIN